MCSNEFILIFSEYYHLALFTEISILLFNVYFVQIDGFIIHDFSNSLQNFVITASS